MSDNGNEKEISAGFEPLQVNLPLFDGPLDLLLHLVQKQQLDINELRLSELTEPYLDYLERMQEFNLDQAGDFLTIASQLIWIKSKTLLPRDFSEEEDPETVEELLVLRLREYQKIKEAAHELGSLDRLGRDIFPRRAPSEAPPPSDEEPVFEEVSLFALIEAFREVLQTAERDNTLHLIPERERVEDKISEMLRRMAEEKSIFFRELLAPLSSRGEIILAFIALLELVRLKAVRVVQDSLGGEILCQVTGEFQNSDTDWISAVMDNLMGDEEPLDMPPAG
ncbi:MAG: segregation/condensation protein A [SAR324 cluster bacterium]|nr:segregation/condensation protein A [SAR324 cluster bacterium]MCZ6843439.1 segregation/condensation protein A [SAR324 cluster bacterium]